MHTFLKNFTSVRWKRNRSVVITIKLVTFFVNGITIAILSRFGNTPWLKDRFIISLKGFENSFLNNSKILVGILFDHLLCLFSLTLLSLQYPLVELEKGRLCYCSQGHGRISVFFFDLTMFLFIFSATLVKKLLK